MAFETHTFDVGPCTSITIDRDKEKGFCTLSITDLDGIEPGQVWFTADPDKMQALSQFILEFGWR